MVCDAIQGCGQYAFGEDMPLEVLELTAMVARANRGNAFSVNVTPLTHMAAVYADSLGPNRENILLANAKAGNLFGISELVTSAAPDLTVAQPGDAVSAADVKHALFAAAVAAVAQEDFQGDIARAVASLAETYAIQGGELLYSESVDDPSRISLSELANAALQTSIRLGLSAQAIQETAQLASTASMASQRDRLTNTYVRAAGDGSPLATAKALVPEVRSWASVLQTSSSDTFSDHLDTVAPFASMQWQRMQSQETVYALVHALRGMVRAYQLDFQHGNAIREYLPMVNGWWWYPHEPDEVRWASGDIWIDSTEQTVHFAGYINGKWVTIVLDQPRIQNRDFVVTVRRADVGTTLVVNSGAARGRVAGSEVPRFVILESGFEVPALENLWLDLDITMIRNYYRSEPHSFDGRLQVNLIPPAEELADRVEAVPQSLLFQGRFRRPDGFSFSASLAAVLVNAANFVPEEMEPIVDLSLGVTTPLEGLPAATLGVSGGNNLADGHFELAIMADGRRLDASVSLAEGSLRVTNQDGVSLDLSIVGDQAAAGTLAYEGRQYGEIRESRGIPVIVYEDGEFESLY